MVAVSGWTHGARSGARGGGFTEELRRPRTATTELPKLRMTETAEVQRRCTAEGAAEAIS
ncbi:hypothetical protein SESBI_43359, partial [Sesbania bispinosa]